MAWATMPNGPPSRRQSDTAWPTRPLACPRGYYITRSSSRGQTRIRGPTTKFLRGSRFIGSRVRGLQPPSGSTMSSHSRAVIAFPKTTVPVGLSFFPKDPARSLEVLLRSKGRVVFESEHKVGGYFSAYEQPGALVGDLRKMFGKSGPTASVVPGCTGY
ncbi:hypothetical protein EDB85DRAFT_839005 [Lactarius pseudohatsudake]|nr:hypothetical protein EDB85DRAFT_839005 [Lactarius pseudohatsudake]